MNLNVGYIIINPDKNPSGLRISNLSIVRHHIGDPEIIQIVPKNTSPMDVKKLKDQCPDTFKGGDTITSLINTGFKKLRSDWGMIVFAGTSVKTNLIAKYEGFGESNRDIFYPVIERKFNFVDGSINGMTINKGFFTEIGDFPENHMWKLDEDTHINSFDICKLIWASDAMEKGCKFKAILGCKLNG